MNNMEILFSDTQENRGVISLPLPPGDTAQEPAQDIERPFVIEHLRQAVQQGGHFQPGARIILAPALRTSGLLFQLPSEDARSLILMLTFLTANGNVCPSVYELAGGMQVSEGQARLRMERLTKARFQGQPLAFLIARESGIDAYGLSPHLFKDIHQESIEPVSAPLRVAGRDAIIAHTRKNYAKPRAEVEAMIANQMGWEPTEPPGDPQERAVWEIRQSLRLLGVSKDQIERILTNYPIQQIQQQVEWLPYRNANNPMRYLIAAIEGHYDMPLSLKQQAALLPPVNHANEPQAS